MYPKELKIGLWTDVCISMFMTASFAIAKRCRQPKYPSEDGWVKKMWCINAMGYHPALGTKEILSYMTTWKTLVDITLSDINQSQNKSVWCHLYKGYKVGGFFF